MILYGHQDFVKSVSFDNHGLLTVDELRLDSSLKFIINMFLNMHRIAVKIHLMFKQLKLKD